MPPVAGRPLRRGEDRRMPLPGRMADRAGDALSDPVLYRFHSPLRQVATHALNLYSKSYRNTVFGWTSF